MDSSRRTAYTAARSKIDALSWASEASSNGQVDGEARKGRPVWVVTSIFLCVCVGGVERREETDRCLAQLYTPNGASAMIVSMKGGSDLHHLCCFYFPVLLESDTDTHRHTHTYTYINVKLCRQGYIALTKVKHYLAGKITFHRTDFYSVVPGFDENLQRMRLLYFKRG